MNYPYRLGAPLLLTFFLSTWPLLASDPSPGKTESTVWDAGPGAKLRFQGFPSATPPDSAALPQVDLTELPGSRIVLRRGVQQTSSGLDHQGASLFAVCLQAPSTALPPHADEVAFDRMEVRIREEFTRDGAQMNLFAPGPRVELGKLQVLPFSGEATPLKARSGIKKYLRGKNFVGFVGEPPEILVCSFACVETSTVPHTLCGPVVESASLEGVFVPPPRPSALVRAALRVRERTVPALGLLLGALLIFAGAGVVLWPARRPA